ncbi:hypothetical protein AVEN_67637-1 [Araneus ventricosus]|uniref:Uncharacterized protein n=1 Tax=Araneus ventricosus TaxID=182803 RepID=A0A4Y2QE56_ARAVE|nr:hypothetical protein AVEN_11132-1 [Araneus ventricosus]GBN60907.1 hypothetical protein AVEN_22678-1 [Araneus ventricosus]GBN60937.1 hypothetical protein AVEN_45695-1 [Araneus ventricosus]GBN60955.1 hypothetical protein AVEN_67637-1 [Araneus ventricosus]
MQSYSRNRRYVKNFAQNPATIGPKWILDSQYYYYETELTAVALWQDVGFGAGEFQVRTPIPPKIRRFWDMQHVKSYVEAKRPPAGMVLKF